MHTATRLLRLTAAPAVIAALSVAGTALAQEVPLPIDQAADTPATETEETEYILANTGGIPSANRAIYEPAYFTQYAPRNALDMLRQVPGFSIRGGGDGGRGLGQADENIVVNGERLTSKSDSARDQIARIPAGDVVRIEIVDGSSLDIPGLTGQVANIVVNITGLSGQFSWQGGYRVTRVDPAWYGGEVSISGSSGPLTYTLALQNENNRFGADGPNVITDGNGTIIERQFSDFVGAFDVPRISANLGYEFSHSVKANLNASLERSIFNRNETELQQPVGAGEVFRVIDRSGGAPEYEISGDIEFPLGGGALKLIGLTNYDGNASENILIDRYADGRDATGSRFTQDGFSTENIARAEYGWNMWGADWQLSGEAAYNKLDRVSGLFELDSTGAFVELDFPEGTGQVKEDRYEAILSFSRPIADKLSLQATLGGEVSTIEQTGFAAETRSFQRPKGSISLAWKPERGLDISLEARRTVGQLSFGDVLARVSLDDGNEDAGNNQLVPEQSWDYTLEISKSLGKWGSTTLSVERRQIEDYIDVIPLAGGGESRGNIASATSTEIEWNSTFKLDPLGINGAEIDFEVEYQPTSVRDPVTGVNRPFSGQTDFRLNANYRHDIPNSDWAYGLGVFRFHNTQYFRLGEFGRGYEGPVFADLFVEHKDVFGLTMSATYANVLNARNKFDRTVFDGVRGEDPILFVENQNRRIGPIFRFSVSGNF